jgi:hypothetical protein
MASRHQSLCPLGNIIAVAFADLAVGEEEVEDPRFVAASEQVSLCFEVGNINFCKFL